MWTTETLEALSLTGPSGLTIGAFDGVHRGHQALIRRLVESARAAQRRSVVVTFNPLPLQVFSEDENVLLTSIEERAAYVRQLGVDGFVALTFNRALAQTSAHDFVTLMIEHLNMVDLWVGPDFALGHDRRGDGQALQQMGEKRGFNVHRMQPFRWQGETVRSTRIREVLQSGDVTVANDLLGHPYRLTGSVERWTNTRHTSTTAKLQIPSERVLPAPGTYVGRVHVGGRTKEALVHVRKRAPSSQNATSVRLQLLMAADDMEGGKVKVDFLTYLHPLSTFTATWAKIIQFHEDRSAARQWLEEHPHTFAEVSTKTKSRIH